MARPNDNLNDKDPNSFPSEDDAEHLEDRGDEAPEEEEEEEPEPKAKKKAAKEEDPDEEEEDSDEEEEDSDEEDEPDTRGKSVPLSVHRKIQQKRQRAEENARQLQEKLTALETSKSEGQKKEFEKVQEKLDELYEKVEISRAEGKTREAAAHQKEIDKIRDSMTRTQAAWTATKNAVEQQNLNAYNALVAELETLDPRFDEGHDDYDDELVDSVRELTDAYEGRGMAAPEALRKAAKLILGGDPFRAKKSLERESKKPDARKTDFKKNASAQKRQPAEDSDKIREKTGKLNPLKLSDDDWDKLPESKKAELRGDFG